MARWRRTERGLALAGLFAALAPGVRASQDPPPPDIAFARHGQPVASLDLAALQQIAAPATVRVHEPYEGREAAFRALPFAAVLDAVYGAAWRGEEELLFTCRDGYQPTVPVARALAHRAWLAFARADQPAFTISKLESGARRDVDLSPFYLVWENRDDALVSQEGDYGWPYQLVGVDLIRTRERFPRMAPPPGAGPEVLAGFAAFRVHCSRCHKLNGEGGGIGPELNAAGSPLAMRERDWLRAWIAEPSRILPTARMEPLNPALPDRERTIDEILAYLEAMASAGARPGPEPAPFAAFYASPLQHPILLWLAAGAALGFCATRRGLAPSTRRYCQALVALSLADAWLTASHVYGLGTLPAWAARALPLGFVLAGDFRFLLLLGAATAAGGVEPSARRVLAAAALTLVVPLGSQAVLLALPEPWRSEPRVLFLVYETGFLLLTLALLRWHPGARSAPWLVPVARFVLLYYALWAGADALILATGSDAGFLLRVVPNVLYYGGLIAVIAGAAAQAGRGSARKAATAEFQAAGSSK